MISCERPPPHGLRSSDGDGPATDEVLEAVDLLADAGPLLVPLAPIPVGLVLLVAPKVLLALAELA